MCTSVGVTYSTFLALPLQISLRPAQSFMLNKNQVQKAQMLSPEGSLLGQVIMSYQGKSTKVILGNP